MATRHRNDGIRKRCDCPRAKWPKCSHQWHFSFKWKDVHHRFSLDRHLNREITSKSEAESEAEKLRVAIKAGTFGSPVPVRDALTLGRLLDVYRDDVLKVRPGGLRTNDESQMRVLKGVPLRQPTGVERPLADWLVVDVTSATLEQFRTARAVQQTVTRKGRGGRRLGGPGSVNRGLSFLRRVFNWAIRAGHLESTPFKRHGVTIVRLSKESKRTRRLDDGEADRLLAACGPHLRAVVECALATGMRRGEILGLQWADVALQAGEIRLPASKTKTATGRTIPISTRLRAILALRTTKPGGDAMGADDFVFGTEIGTRVLDVKAAWNGACRRAGLTDLRLHDLRREAGSRWLDAGVPLHTVRDWLGHTSVAQTSTYLSTTARTSHDAMRRFERVQQGATDDETRHHQPPPTNTTPNTEPRENTSRHDLH